jgi:alkylated DNA repair dioxygenase AlkB
MKRLQTASGEPGTSYRYSGTRIDAKPWTHTLSALRSRLRAATGEDLNFVLINLYRSGCDSISWHRDDERDLVKPTTILSLSLGAVRDFQLSPVRDAIRRVFTIPLESGGLLLMRHPTNQLFKHQVPPRRRVAEPRLNLTWRSMISSTDRDSSLLHSSAPATRNKR